MAVLADIAGLSLDDSDVILRAGAIEPYQSVDPVALAPAASTFSALSDSAAYGDYYSPAGLDEQSSSGVLEQDGLSVAGGPKSACNPCKKNHTKCSGEQPICMQCQKRKIPCSYSPQKKRGPKTGQIKSLQEEVKQLTELVEQQRKQLAALQQSSADDARKRRRDNVSAITGPDPEIRPDLAMPSFVNEYIRLFEEYIEPGCMLRDPSGARTSLDTVKVLLQLSPNVSNPVHARQLLGMYTMLASGAQVFGNPVHAQEFITRARTAAQQLFDVSDISVAGGFDRIAFYLIGLGDLDRARLYNGIALRMLENLNTPLQHPIHLSVLLGRGLLVKNIEERISISNRLRESGTLNGEMLGLTLALKVKLHLFRTGEPIRLDECLPILARADELLKQRLLPERRQLTTKAMIKGIKAGVYYAVGQLAVAEQHADAATRLSKTVGSNGQYATFCVAVGMEWAAEVHTNRGKIDLLREDCNILEAIAARFPIMTEVSRRYTMMLAAMTQVPSAAAPMQVPVSVEMLAPESFALPEPSLGDLSKMGLSGDLSVDVAKLGDLTRMGGSDQSLERLLSSVDAAVNADPDLGAHLQS